jgi:hypothetical protein
VRLSGEELVLFNAACADTNNIHAQELLNLFAAETPEDVLYQVRHAPIGVFVDVVSHIWYAILHEASLRDMRWSEILERALG